MPIMNSILHGHSWMQFILALLMIGVCIAIALGLARAALTLLRMTLELLRTGFGLVSENAATITINFACFTARMIVKLLSIAAWYASRPFVRLWNKVYGSVLEWFDNIACQIELERARKATHGGKTNKNDESQQKSNNSSTNDFNQQTHTSYEVPRTFAEACLIFGLPVTGEFTKAALSAAYRQRIHKAHPDRDGINDLATQLNVARDLIKAHKGWV
ncbi:MAG: hypothetical protein QM808_17775 [Steroidobacteraceae bacterium]